MATPESSAHHSSPTTIAVCGDSHAWFGATQAFGQFGEQLQPWSAEILANLRCQLRREQPDLLLHLGDFTCGGGVFEMPEEDFKQTLPQVISTLQDVGSTFHGIPGNHDTPFESGSYEFCEQLLGLPRGQGLTIDIPQARLILVHSQGHSADQIQAALPGDPVYGWVAEEELVRVETDIVNAGNKPILLFIHQLLVPWTVAVPWKDYYEVKNRDTLLGILERHPNVVAVFQAHAHLYDVQRVHLGDKDRLFIVIPSTIQYPLGWLLLRVASNRLEIELRRLTLPDLQERSRTHDPYGDARAGRREWEMLTYVF